MTLITDPGRIGWEKARMVPMVVQLSRLCQLSKKSIFGEKGCATTTPTFSDPLLLSLKAVSFS
jgi:hypothetical protein